MMKNLRTHANGGEMKNMAEETYRWCFTHRPVLSPETVDSGLFRLLQQAL